MDGSFHDLPVVELRLAVVSAVESNVLWSDEVFSHRSSLGNRELNPVLIPRAPSILGEVLARVADAGFHDLEPVAVTLVRRRRGGSLGHVHELRAGVLHGSPDAELHGELLAGLDLGRLRLCGALEGALVAAEVGEVRGHVVARVLPLGGVVLRGAGVVADVLHGPGLLAVDDELFEEVVGGDGVHEGSARDEGGGKLHGVGGWGGGCCGV